MNNLCKMIAHITQSEKKVSEAAKEFKECEGVLKNMNEESKIIAEKRKKIDEELEYKRKIVIEKELELTELLRECETWENMLKEKKALLDVQTDELDAMQHKVWNTRREFHDKAAEFLSKNNFLTDINSRIEKLIQKHEEKNNLANSNDILEEKVNSLEKEYNKLKANYDLMQHLEKEKQTLLEFEHSPDIIRLQNKIANKTRELEVLEKELSKYRSTPTEVLVPPNQANLSGEFYDQCAEKGIQIQSNMDKVKPFRLKMPSFLIQRQSPFYRESKSTSPPGSSAEKIE